MKFLPPVLIILSFITICIGVYLKTQHYPGASFVISGGMAAESVFILFNRMMFSRRQKNDKW